jgi:general secretion pathway protein B
MSTILKALDKNKHSQQVMMTEQKNETTWKWIMAAALLLIVLLLSVVAILLFKSTTTANQTTVIDEVNLTAQQQSIIEKEIVSPVSLVSDVTFETEPLPLELITQAPQEPEQQWISAEKSPQNQFAQTEEVSEPVTVDDGAEIKLADNFAINDVSDELQRRFALAVEQESDRGNNDYTNDQPQLVAADIESLPATFQFKVPVMSYDSHMYSTDSKDRWIRINGVDLRVGEYIGDIELVDILPQQSVFRLGKQSFTLQSLKDWKG